jgi:leucyl/phenylalanyl-tRNA--protein transferase
MFFGESMFSRVPNASKIALVFLARRLQAAGFPLIDCQVYNDHLGSMGAIVITRENFIELHETLVKQPGIIGNWSSREEFAFGSDPLSADYEGNQPDLPNE